MADKSFGVKELNLLNASGTPTVTSPNNLNLNANTVAISTSCTIGNNLTVTSTTNSANLNVTGIGTLSRGFATDLSVSGISTISQPSNANPHSLWDVVNNGSSAYRFTGPGQSGDENNPNIYLVRGQRYIFKVNASGHPFQLRVANGGAAYSDGVTNNGAQSGNVIINVQHDAPAQLYYQCTNHGGMVGNIYIVGGPQVISGVVTATTFSGSGASLTNLPAANLTGTLPAISGANLTSLPAQATIANNADNRVITGGSGVNLNGEQNLTWDGTTLDVTGDYSVKNPSDASYITHTFASNFAKIDVRGTNIANSNHYLIGYGAGHGSANDFHIVNTVGGLVLRTTQERLRIDSDGAVNIGSNPAQATGGNTQNAILTVKGYPSGETSAAILALVRGNNTTSTAAGHTLGRIVFSDKQAGEYAMIEGESEHNGAVGDTPGRLIFSTTGDGNTTPTEQMRIDMDGFVSFGGDTDVGFIRTGTNTLQCKTNGTLCTEFAANQRVRMPQVFSTAGSSMRDVQCESDGTLACLTSITESKINIADVTDVSWLYNLKPKTFNFRKKTVDATTGVNTYLNEAEDEKAYGLLAEDVETINKDFCFYDKDSEGNDVLKGVYYKTMVVPLLKAVQDQKREIDDLKKEVAALKGS